MVGVNKRALSLDYQSSARLGRLLVIGLAALTGGGGGAARFARAAVGKQLTPGALSE